MIPWDLIQVQYSGRRGMWFHCRGESRIFHRVRSVGGDNLTGLADPGFPVGGRGPRRWGRGLPRRLRFENFVCRNERIWTLGWGVRQTRPLGPPMRTIKPFSLNKLGVTQQCVRSMLWIQLWILSYSNHRTNSLLKRNYSLV